MNRTSMLTTVAILAHHLFAMTTHAAVCPIQTGGSVEGYVMPSTLNAEEPFTFAAQGVVEGTVIDIRSTKGEVVASQKTDKLGRIFMRAGLSAGAYVLSRGGKPGATIQVSDLAAPFNPGSPMYFTMPPLLDQAVGLKLSGTGFSGNAADLAVSAEKTNLPVLASTPRELLTGPLSNLKTGSHRFNIGNRATGERLAGIETVLYRVQSRLTRKLLTSGQQTTLQFSVQPKELQADIFATILSGPVHFADGAKSAHIAIAGGAGQALLAADPSGIGKFNLAWEMSNIAFLMAPEGQGSNSPPKAESTDPCPATRHTMKPIGVWKVAGKRGDLFLATRERQCSVQECRLKKSHGGDHEFGAPKACPDKDRDTEEMTFETEDARAKFIKEAKAGGK